MKNYFEIKKLSMSNILFQATLSRKITPKLNSRYLIEPLDTKINIFRSLNWCQRTLSIVKIQSSFLSSLFN